MDQVYFGIKGLESYGFKKDANKLKAQLLKNAEGLTGSNPIRENYHPETGVMQGATNFGWSAAHLFLLFKETAGLAEVTSED